MYVCPFNVQIVKQEWPMHWSSFIDEIVGASKTSETLCTNNMVILKLLRYLYHAKKTTLYRVLES